MSATARAIIEDYENNLLFSIGSVWEIAIKTSLGKLELEQPLETFLLTQIAENLLELLPITAPHAVRVASLPFHHRDPFDRLLVAQALVEQVPILSFDSAFDHYGIERLW